MGCGASTDSPTSGIERSVPPPRVSNTAPRPTRDKYKHRGPASKVRGGGIEETPMFKGDDVKSQLYKYEAAGIWYFYNDGLDVETHIHYVFGPDSKIESVGRTELHKVDDGFDCKLVVYPGETEPFIKGEPNGFKTTFGTHPLSEAYLSQQRKEKDAKVASAIAALKPLKAATEEDTLRNCVDKGVQYVDMTFTPGDNALSRPRIDADIPKTAWERPRDYLIEKWHPFVCLFNNIEPNDIDQGSLGDCYLLCSLASLAEFPSKVKDVFAHPISAEAMAKEQAVGAYRVTLNKGGWWSTIILDNYFPTKAGVPCFAKNREDPSELWVMLLEKAYAKANGSYSAIAGGDPLQALQDLTGYPITRIDEALANAVSGDSTLFEHLKRWDGEKALITISTPGQDSAAYAGGKNDAATQSIYDKAGLALGHAYSVLRVVDVNGHQLVQIRNPWGNGVEWTGAWGDNDPKWKSEPAVAKACNYVKADDGTFWMEWSDVLRYFKSGGTCFTKFDWFDYRVRGQFSAGRPNVALEVTVTKRTSCFLSLHQQDKRGKPQSDPDHKYASFILAVSRKDGAKQKVHMHGTMNAEVPSPDPLFITGRDVAMRYVFEPEHSPYVVFPRIYEQGGTKDYVLAAVMEHKVHSGVEIKFRTLSRECPVFENYLSFEYDSATEESVVETDYQYNPEIGAPQTRRGTRINL